MVTLLQKTSNILVSTLYWKGVVFGHFCTKSSEENLGIKVAIFFTNIIYMLHAIIIVITNGLEKQNKKGSSICTPTSSIQNKVVELKKLVDNGI